GADADIAIYNIDPRRVDPSRSYREVRRAFEKAAYTIKGGRIVVRNGEVVKSVWGRTIWVDVRLKSPAEVSADMKRRFREYWTVEFENYIIPQDYLRGSLALKTEAEV
ncbi:formylmethanofuran dehydrogenase subunit A, partial [Candidatus Bathyarchaeota archaeon]